MNVLGLILIACGMAGFVSLVLVAPYKPTSLRDYTSLVFRHVGITSMVVIFAVSFALGVVLLIGK